MAQIVLAALSLVVYVTVGRPGPARALGYVAAAASGALAGVAVVKSGTIASVVITAAAVGFYYVAGRVAARHDAGHSEHG